MTVSAVVSGVEPDRSRMLQDILSREECRTAARPKPIALIVDFSLVWAQAILGLAVFAYTFSVAGFLIGVILVGSAQHGLSQIAHEGVHYLIAPGRRQLNDAIARWLFAAPVVLPYSLYRRRHLVHHRHVATGQDTKEMYRRDIVGARLLMEILSSLSGADYIRQVIGTLRRDNVDRQTTAAAGAPDWVKQELPAVAITQLILLIVLSAIDVRLYFLMWVLPLVTVSMLCSKIRSIVEHKPSADMIGAKPGSGYYLDTEAPCLRSVEATWLERVFLSKVNFHFHAEHHLWPFVSYQHLPLVHQRLQQSGRARQMGCSVERSYRTALRNLWVGK